MENKRSIGDVLSGKDRERMPNVAFHIMTGLMKLADLFVGRSAKNFLTLNLKPGQTVIDYGCGPARYVPRASQEVGESGRVIAVDIHPLAIKKVEAKIAKYNLANAEAVLASGYPTPIADEIADVVYALDMFHMVEHPAEFLSELSRLAKPDGTVIIEDGHQPRAETLKKIEAAAVLDVIEENRFHVKCRRRNPDNFIQG